MLTLLKYLIWITCFVARTFILSLLFNLYVLIICCSSRIYLVNRFSHGYSTLYLPIAYWNCMGYGSSESVNAPFDQSATRNFFSSLTSIFPLENRGLVVSTMKGPILYNNNIYKNWNDRYLQLFVNARKLQWRFCRTRQF